MYKGIIYQVINIQNNKSYIGQTCRSLNTRKEGHMRMINSKKHFYNAIRKYGENNFKWITLGEIFANTRLELKQKLNEAEIECIWLFRTYGSNGENWDRIYGYNLTKGGKGILGCNKSKGKGKIPWNKGLNKYTSKSLEKLSTRNKILLKGKIPWNKGLIDCYSEKTKKDMGKNSKGQKIGFKHSEETKNKMSESHLGKKWTEERKNNHKIVIQKMWNERRCMSC